MPWFPYNFHAGNYFDFARQYSSQDATTAELLAAGCSPMPTWVFSTKFTLEELGEWTARQLNIFEQAGRTLHQVGVHECRGVGVWRVCGVRMFWVKGYRWGVGRGSKVHGCANVGRRKSQSKRAPLPSF